jgi:hypothetical protein
VAGLRLDGKGWVRPVVPVGDGSLTRRQYTYADSSEVAILDVLSMDLLRPNAEPHHPENWILGDKSPQLKARSMLQTSFLLDLLKAQVEHGPKLLGGDTDKRAAYAIGKKNAEQSLTLVAPKEVDWEVRLGYRGQRSLRAIFSLSGHSYDLRVTDPVWEQKFAGLQPDTYEFKSPDSNVEERFLLTISLGEEFQGYHYKLVAGVIMLPAALRDYF